MRMLNARCAIVAVAVGGFAVGTGLFGSAAASADAVDDIGPLLTSSCSFAQIDSALHEVAPDTAARLDSVPLQKNVLQLVLSQPADKRAAMYEQLTTQRKKLASTTGMDAGLGVDRPEIGPVMQRVADSCQRY